MGYWAASRTPLSCAYAAASSTVIRLLLACGAAPDICLACGWEDIHFEDKCKELQETCRGRMLRGTITAPSLHHHCTITAPSLHHHCTIIAPSFSRNPSPRSKKSSWTSAAKEVPSLHH